MNRRWRMMSLIALGSILAMAPAAPAQKEDDRPATAPGGEVGPFVRAGDWLINVRRIDFVEIHRAEAGAWLIVHVGSRPQDQMPRIRARDAGPLLKVMGLPPIDPPTP